jgi:glycosyltransferase involved in cell wall biosynthesis
MPPLVSVVIPCFNAGPMLRPALLSIVDQTYPNLEIIFVDNNSTDDSATTAAAIAAKSSRPFKLLRCPTQGANYARNLGYTEVCGDYVQWMDADDLMDPTKIALQVEALEQRREFDVAYCDWTERRLGPDGNALLFRHDLAPVADQILRTLATIWYPPHTYLFRRQATERLQELEAWFPPRKITEDIEYIAIAAMAGMRFLYVPRAHVHYNIWGLNQLGSSANYAARAAVHRDMFARLRQVAESLGPSLRLSAQHKLLLNQSWDVWALRSLSIVKLPGRRFRLDQKETGRSIELRPREAQVLAALQGRLRPLTLCHLALEAGHKAPELAKDHVAILTTLQRLAQAGFLERVHEIDA